MIVEFVTVSMELCHKILWIIISESVQRPSIWVSPLNFIICVMDFCWLICYHAFAVSFLPYQRFGDEGMAPYTSTAPFMEEEKKFFIKTDGKTIPLEDGEVHGQSSCYVRKSLGLTLAATPKMNFCC